MILITFIKSYIHFDTFTDYDKCLLCFWNIMNFSFYYCMKSQKHCQFNKEICYHIIRPQISYSHKNVWVYETTFFSFLNEIRDTNLHLTQEVKATYIAFQLLSNYMFRKSTWIWNMLYTINTICSIQFSIFNILLWIIKLTDVKFHQILFCS